MGSSKYIIPLSDEFSKQGKYGKTVTLTGDSLQLAFIYLEPGAEIPWHSHSQEAMITLLKGSIEQWVGNEHFVLRPGYAVWIPSNVPHRAIVGPEFTIEIETFSPVREEFATRSPEFDLRNK
jgi:quercetin dioxygenase-like cupin family protein